MQGRRGRGCFLIAVNAGRYRRQLVRNAAAVRRFSGVGWMEEDRQPSRQRWPERVASTSHAMRTVGRLMAPPKAGRRARLAIFLTALALPLCAAPVASAAGTEFYGIAQGTLELQDRKS